MTTWSPAMNDWIECRSIPRDCLAFMYEHYSGRTESILGECEFCDRQGGVFHMEKCRRRVTDHFRAEKFFLFFFIVLWNMFNLPSTRNLCFRITFFRTCKLTVLEFVAFIHFIAFFGAANASIESHFSFKCFLFTAIFSNNSLETRKYAFNVGTFCRNC